MPIRFTMRGLPSSRAESSSGAGSPSRRGRTPLAVTSHLYVAIALWVSACAYSGHPVRVAELGVPRSSRAMTAVLDLPGTVTVKTVISADWPVPLSGLLNLDHPKAKAAGLHDRDERMHI